MTFNSFELVSVSGQTGACDAEKYLYVDGAQTGSSTTATFDTATGSGSPYRVGAGATESASGNYFWEGDIAEQIVFNVVLSQTERYQVDTYLALKYGIHISHNYLASDETSLWDATANSTYHNDVAGIGRDDASGLNQKQSTSQGGGIVEIGLGAIATDNASNANSFSGDLAFMVWGHDNATTSLATAFSGSSINMRMARIWKVEETSTVGTVEIQIPDSYSATHLIVSSSSSLTSPTETALTDNGDGTMSTTVNFSDGDYFSFGSSSVGPGGVAANLNMWFKADAGVFSDNGCTTALTGSDTNDALGCWVDQSNNGFVTSQSSSSLRADHSIGGLNYNPVFTFDESDDDRLDFATTPITAPSDIHAYYILDENDSDGDNHLLASETGGRFYIRTMTASFGDNASVTETVPSGTYMANAHYDLGTTTMTFSVDAGTPITESQNWSSAPTGNFKLGAHGSGSGDSFNQYNGTLAEMIVYTADHANGNDEQKIQSYLGLKYGLSLPITYIASDATTLWDATSNASYHNDVAGIGRDDDSELNQKQSASQSSGIVAIGLGALASDNASNANSFSGDVTYMVWGHDNASTDVATAYSGTSTNVRMARIWKVEETNTVGNVEIQIPDTYGATHLIVSSSSALTTPTETLLTDNGDGTMSTTVNFSDGEFFTFGTSTTGPGGVSTSLILWLDADTGVTESSNDVSSWADQSVNGNDATQGTTSFQPDYQSNALNYNPGIAFDGSDDVLDTGMDISAGTISDLTLLAVYKPDVDNAGGVWGEDDTNWDRFIWDNASYDNVVSTGSAGLTITGLFVAEQAVFSTVVFDEDAASGSAVYVDGTLGQQFTANHDPQTSASLQIGSVGSSNHEFDGTIYEVIAYSALLSTTAREQVESYLALKYGITLGHNYLASDGSTIWDYTAQTAYHNDVAGIGRDDEAVLDQRQSVSESGSIVSIGLGAVAADNASNANAFSADLSFLMWGHDNGSTNLATDFSGTDVFTRMARIWKVEEVGTVGTVEIEIPDTYDATHLIVSSSSALTSPTEVALTDNGDGTRSATLDFTDGQYFTFGVGASPGGVFTDIELWLRADVGVTEAAGDVTTWADQSGSGRDAAVTGVANLPSVSSIDIHYNPAIAFDNSNSESLESRSVFGNDTHSNINLFAVATVNSLANSFLFGEGSGSSDRVSAHIPWQSNLTIFWDAGANTGDNRLSTGWTESLATPYLWAFEYEASGPVQTIYKDGTSLVSDATVSTFTFAGTNAFQIGSYRGIEFIDADIAEMIAFNGALSDTEQQQIQTYLAIKYGITLGHNYLASDASTLWDVTANAPYQNDVIGIAREDESALNQKQAAAGIMTVALGALAADNASNANSFSSDAVFLIVGHDNGALTESAVTVGAYSADRLARVWFAEETGDTGATLALTFDLTGITVSGTVAADFQLVLDTDTDPSNGTRQIIAATSFASDVVTFSSVDIADNDYLILLTDYDLAPVGPPVTDGVAADGVLGQPDYDSSIKNNGGISASTLNNPGYFAMGPSGKVFVADTQNHRVLRWGSVNAAMDGSAAEAVLGQADFTSNSANRGSTVAANTMYTPSGIFVTSSGALFVADSENHRILRFDNAESASDGANADGVLGQADFISNEENRRQDVAANSLRWPKDLYMDSGGRLWAVDWLNHRVLRYDSATSKADGAGADGVLGQANFTTRILEWQNQTDINSLAYPAGVFVDNSGRLWVTDAGNSRILRFDTAASKANGADADGVLGQADFTSWRVNRGSTLAANTLHWPDAGIDGDNQGGIWVADRWNDRVLWYEDAAAKADGAAADAVLGQTDFTSSHGLVDNASFNSVHDVFIDTASDQVWIVDSAHNRVLRFDAAANSLGKTQESPELLIEEIPESFDLYQNYPNPFNPQTTIGYDIPEPVHVSIRVFDVLGRPVKVLVDEEMQAGKHEVHFEASGLAAGIYLYQMRAGTEVHVKKMILAK
ncbi:MAG: T9SS type A sorting domain-containing protein [Bacteroidota bacterium]